MSKLKVVDSNYFDFDFDLFFFILFLELELELKWQDYAVTYQSHQMT